MRAGENKKCFGAANVLPFEMICDEGRDPAGIPGQRKTLESANIHLPYDSNGCMSFVRIVVHSKTRRRREAPRLVSTIVLKFLQLKDLRVGQRLSFRKPAILQLFV